MHCAYSGTTIIAERGVRTERIKIKRVYVENATIDEIAMLKLTYDCELLSVAPDEVLTILRG